jgi:hypothetical protein
MPFPRRIREHRGLVIEVVDRLRITIPDEDVLVAVVVEVGEQRAPAPVGVRDAGERPTSLKMMSPSFVTPLLSWSELTE